MRGLQEVVPIQDTLCSGIGAIERLDGDLIRFWLYVLQESEDADEPEKVVVAKIVGPFSGMSDAILQLTAAVVPRTVSMVSIVTGLMMG